MMGKRGFSTKKSVGGDKMMLGFKRLSLSFQKRMKKTSAKGSRRRKSFSRRLYRARRRNTETLRLNIPKIYEVVLSPKSASLRAQKVGRSLPMRRQTVAVVGGRRRRRSSTSSRRIRRPSTTSVLEAIVSPNSQEMRTFSRQMMRQSVKKDRKKTTTNLPFKKPPRVPLRKVKRSPRRKVNYLDNLEKAFRYEDNPKSPGIVNRTKWEKLLLEFERDLYPYEKVILENNKHQEASFSNSTPSYLLLEQFWLWDCEFIDALPKVPDEVERYEGEAVSIGKSRFYVPVGNAADGKRLELSWKECELLGYNEHKKMFLIRWTEEPRKCKFVYRQNIIFGKEFEETFFLKLNLAKLYRLRMERRMRHILQIEKESKGFEIDKITQVKNANLLEDRVFSKVKMRDNSESQRDPSGQVLLGEIQEKVLDRYRRKFFRELQEFFEHSNKRAIYEYKLRFLVDSRKRSMIDELDLPRSLLEKKKFELTFVKILHRSHMFKRTRKKLTPQLSMFFTKLSKLMIDTTVLFEKQPPILQLPVSFEPWEWKKFICVQEDCFCKYVERALKTINEDCLRMICVNIKPQFFNFYQIDSMKLFKKNKLRKFFVMYNHFIAGHIRNNLLEQLEHFRNRLCCVTNANSTSTSGALFKVHLVESNGKCHLQPSIEEISGGIGCVVTSIYQTATNFMTITDKVFPIVTLVEKSLGILEGDEEFLEKVKVDVIDQFLEKFKGTAGLVETIDNLLERCGSHHEEEGGDHDHISNILRLTRIQKEVFDIPKTFLSGILSMSCEGVIETLLKKVDKGVKEHIAGLSENVRLLSVDLEGKLASVLSRMAQEVTTLEEFDEMQMRFIPKFECETMEEVEKALNEIEVKCEFLNKQYTPTPGLPSYVSSKMHLNSIWQKIKEFREAASGRVAEFTEQLLQNVSDIKVPIELLHAKLPEKLESFNEFDLYNEYVKELELLNKQMKGIEGKIQKYKKRKEILGIDEVLDFSKFEQCQALFFKSHSLWNTVEDFFVLKDVMMEETMGDTDFKGSTKKVEELAGTLKNLFKALENTESNASAMCQRAISTFQTFLTNISLIERVFMKGNDEKSKKDEFYVNVSRIVNTDVNESRSLRDLFDMKLGEADVELELLLR